jgi:DNA-binding NtrC family response regulator
MNRMILVVDDDLQIRNSLRKVLSGEGYEVALAGDSYEAIKQFNARQIGLVLLDLTMPGKSGWDIFEAVTTNDPTLPIVIITGRQDQSELAAAAGVSAIMEKPLNVPLLLQTIDKLFNEAPEMRLKRLVGHSKILIQAPSQAAGSSVAPHAPRLRRNARQENKNPIQRP